MRRMPKKRPANGDVSVADLGETELRGFEDPARLYEVHWEK